MQGETNFASIGDDELKDILALTIFQSLHTQNVREAIRFQFLNVLSAQNIRIKPIAVRAVSGHRHIPILDPMRFASTITPNIVGMVAGLFHITEEYTLLPILKHGLLPGHLIPRTHHRQGRADVHFTGFPFQGRRTMQDNTRR